MRQADHQPLLIVPILHQDVLQAHREAQEAQIPAEVLQPMIRVQEVLLAHLPTITAEAVLVRMTAAEAVAHIVLRAVRQEVLTEVVVPMVVEVAGLLLQVAAEDRMVVI